MTNPLGEWSPRRRYAALVLAMSLGALFVGVSISATGADRGVAGWVLLAVVTVAAAGTLASYVPERGLRPDLGCSPCAAVSAFTVVAAYLLMRNVPTDPAAAVLAAAVALLGLGQRLATPASCEVHEAPVPEESRSDLR